MKELSRRCAIAGRKVPSKEYENEERKQKQYIDRDDDDGARTYFHTPPDPFGIVIVACYW